ncbi:hypothetical protein [Winogradskyella sp. UBA3174]|uniref:hypothetical protein n=1 Tax=Winogradskyella sp. UBA3174 TaxID=1947785 RepID=UPI0025E3A380|nr:hypothetical protein [Winogradskyella sp. UBA3174]|tara:strand:+ start:32200 stop:32937 length:738 start_codon:yes stop_codon:yes gene_type:complete
MKKIINNVFVLLCMVAVLNSCEEQEPLNDLSNYVSFGSTGNFAFAVPEDQSSSVDVKVYATETKSSDRTFSVLVDDASTLTAGYTVPATVTIPAGSSEGSMSVTVTDDATLGFVAQTLILNFDNEVGVDFGSALTVSVSQECLLNKVQFKLTLDTWPDETTWSISDIGVTPAVVLFSGGPYVNPDDDFAVLTFDFCLGSGDYEVVVNDSYGDGIADGGYTVSVGTTEVVNGVVPGASSSATFTID